jgi:hypothetical protein
VSKICEHICTQDLDQDLGYRYQDLRYRYQILVTRYFTRGTRQFNGLIDVYRKTLATDGILRFYRGFFISCVGFVVYRGLYFGMFDSLKPVVLSGPLTNNFFAK